MMMRTGKDGRAFTVIELLVVIGIIVILSGILVPVLMLVRARAKRNFAEATMKSICVALDRHFAERGFYPPDTGMFLSTDRPILGIDTCQDNNDGTNDPFSLYKALCGPNGAGVVETLPSLAQETFGPYMTFKPEQLLGDGGLTGDEYIAIDSWGNPWVYEESHSYSRMRSGTEELKNYVLTHNPTRYDIYSVGPNGILDVELHNAQDLDGDGNFDAGDDDGDGLFDETDEGVDGNVNRSDDITNWN